MAEQTKLTKEIIEKLISEEMEKIDESWFDQMRARVKGKLAKYGAIGKGVKSFIKQDLDIEAFKDIDPLEIERLTRVISILDPYQEKFRN